MRRDEWQRAFGGTPEAVERRVQQTLQDLKEEKTMKRKMSVAVLVALAAVLALAGTAFAVANGMGIGAFLSRFGGRFTVDEAIIEAARGESADTRYVKYTAQEVVFDGDTVQMTVVCEPLEPERVMLVGADEMEDDWRTAAGDTIPATDGQADPSWVTVREYAEQNQLDVVCATVALPTEESSVYYVSQGGKLYYYVRGTFAQGEQPEQGEDGQYHLTVDVCDRPWAEEEPERAELAVAVAGVAAQDKSVLTFDQPIDMGAYVIDGMEIRLSRQETALYLRYTVGTDLTDEERAALESMTFKVMVDAQSAEAMDGWGGGARPLAEEADGSGGQRQLGTGVAADGGEPDEVSGQSFLLTLSCNPLEETPEQFYIRPYDYQRGQYGALVALSVADGTVEVRDVPVAQ